MKHYDSAITISISCFSCLHIIFLRQAFMLYRELLHVITKWLLAPFISYHWTCKNYDFSKVIKNKLII